MRELNRPFYQDVDTEFQALDEQLQDEPLAHARLLAELGPNLGRPTVDSMKGSRHANMKELRFGWNDQVGRIVFAFDPRRQAIPIVGGRTRLAPTSGASTAAGRRRRRAIREASGYARRGERKGARAWQEDST